MRFAICNETFGDWELSRALDVARNAGYTGWEVAPYMLGKDVYSISATQRETYREVVQDAGLEVIGLHWLLAKTDGLHLTSPDPETRRRTADYLCELARLCRDLGGQVLVLGSPQQRSFPESQGYRSAFECAVEVLKAVVPTLCDTDTRIALEPLGPQEGNFMNTAEQARALAEESGTDSVRLHLDVKAMSTETAPIADTIRANADLLLHFHANDPNRLGPGMGEVDYLPIFQALKEIGYDGWVSVEVFDYSPGPEAIARQSMQNMQAAMAAAG